MFVYRVEHSETGDGPYQGVHANDDLADAHRGDLTHPSPGFDDGINGHDWRGKVCGFTSIDGFKKWFVRWRKRLAGEGFVLSVYEVDSHRVIRGSHQAMFPKELASRVRQLNLQTLEEVA